MALIECCKHNQEPIAHESSVGITAPREKKVASALAFLDRVLALSHPKNHTHDAVLLELLPNCTMVLVSVCNSSSSYPVAKHPFSPRWDLPLAKSLFGPRLARVRTAFLRSRFLHNPCLTGLVRCGCPRPSCIIPPGARVSFYNRQADHGIRSSNYATVIAEQQGNRFSTPVQERYTTLVLVTHGTHALTCRRKEK